MGEISWSTSFVVVRSAVLVLSCVLQTDRQNHTQKPVIALLTRLSLVWVTNMYILYWLAQTQTQRAATYLALRCVAWLVTAAMQRNAQQRSTSNATRRAAYVDTALNTARTGLWGLTLPERYFKPSALMMSCSTMNSPKRKTTRRHSPRKTTQLTRIVMAGKIKLINGTRNVGV